MSIFMCNDSLLVSDRSKIGAIGHGKSLNFDNEFGEADVPNDERVTLVIIDSRTLLRECLERSIRGRATLDVASFSSVTEWFANSDKRRAALILFSVEDLSKEQLQRELLLLSTAVPVVPTIVIAEKNDLNDALNVLSLGAKGYLSTSMGLDVAIEAMQFVSAGGTYLPVECVLAAKIYAARTASNNSNGTFTSRELAVIQAIRLGQSNKVIAYHLNMCESTVKVHVRHIMKKLHAQNRTEVAIRAMELVNLSD